MITARLWPFIPWLFSRHQCDIAVTDFDPHDLASRPLKEIPHKVIYLCPKYADENTPEPRRAWLRAINDTLDEEVDESLYQQSAIQKLFAAIQRSRFSPEERARMIEENHQEELRQTKFEEGKAEGMAEGHKAACCGTDSAARHRAGAGC